MKITIAPAAITPPIKMIGNNNEELPLSEVLSLCAASIDESEDVSAFDAPSVELSFDEGPEVSLSDDVSDEPLSDEDSKEVPPDWISEELLSEDVSEEVSPEELSGGVSEELSPEDVSVELTSEELFGELDVSCDSYRRVLVSVVPHTAHVLVSMPLLLSVGFLVVTQLPKECLFVFGRVCVSVLPQTEHVLTTFPSDLQVASVVADLYEC